jgi:hypothetical protein
MYTFHFAETLRYFACNKVVTRQYVAGPAPYLKPPELGLSYTKRGANRSARLYSAVPTFRATPSLAT